MAQVKGSVVLDETGEVWAAKMDDMLADCTKIIALRGAGSFNGISVRDANLLLTGHLIPWTDAYLRGDGKVAFIFDGDNDDPEYPDIGHIAGRLRDRFGDQVSFYAVQMLGWYHYRADLPKMRPLHTAKGNEYDTVLFPDKKFPGEHDYFSQNERLAMSATYEQWHVGACGQIASKQLADFSAKAARGPGVHRAVVFGAPVSEDQDRKIRRKIDETRQRVAELERSMTPGSSGRAEEMTSLLDRDQRLTESLIRRAENPFGLLCDASGRFIKKPEYGNLMIELV